MSLFGDILRLLSVASLGLFVGAMLTEGFVLVPYWRSLAPADFFAWYAVNDRRLLGFFGPLTTVTAAVAVAAALVTLLEGHPGRWPAVVAAVLSVVVVSTFFLYFERANASFAAASIAAGDVSGELARWAAWHWLRTGISVAAFAAALWSLGRHG
ncbi:MAG: hypothetical protein ACREQL_09810 [Candidatus Binatia bacterium]